MSAPADILAISDAYRDAVLDVERAALRTLEDAYVDALDILTRDLDDLEARIAAALESGETIRPPWLLQQERYQVLLAQLDDEMDRITVLLETDLTAAQADAVVIGDEAARTLVQVQGAAVPRLPREALIEFVGRMQDGSPLADLLGELGPGARQSFTDQIMRGILRGESPRQVGRWISDALGISLHRAQTISRTEIISSYRNANLATYQQNSDIIQGWRWHAQVGDVRTCASCLAQHGSFHPVTESFASHPACRCAAIPAVVGSTLQIESGSDWFASQDEAYQMRFLGPSKGKAYRDGAIMLDDLVQRGRDDRWGPWTREASLASILGRRANQYYQRGAA